jgi:hypothetical protein
VNHLEGTKTVVGTTSATNTQTTATLVLDTLGYDYASIDVVCGKVVAAGTASSAVRVLTLEQADAETGTYAAIPSPYPTVAASGVTAAASSTNPSVVRLDVDMRGKSRYLRVNATPNSNSEVVVVARLGKAEEHPVTAAGKGVARVYAG